MEEAGTAPTSSPLRDFLVERVERVLASWEAGAAQEARRPNRAAVQRFLEALDELSAATEALAVREGEPSAAAHATARRSVLLASDDEAFAKDLQRSLELRYQVEMAATPEETLRAALAHMPDVVVAAGAKAIEAVRSVRDLRPGVPAVIAAPEADFSRITAEFALEPVVVMGASAGGQEVALTVAALLAPARPEPEPPEPAVMETPAEPRSYAHLAGLLPRSLERTIDFDVGAAVIARPDAEPLIDVHAKGNCSEDVLQLVRKRALALFRLCAGCVWAEEEIPAAISGTPLRSSLHVPLVTEGRVVGLTYLASFRPVAFTAEDERVLSALASHASGAYRRLDGSVRHLRLTPRQSQVLSLIASGLSDNEVATRLGLAHRTVRTHLDRLLREHGLHSRTEAVAAWLRGQQGS